jgi:hypothetical protein
LSSAAVTTINHEVLEDHDDHEEQTGDFFVSIVMLLREYVVTRTRRPEPSPPRPQSTPEDSAGSADSAVKGS